MGASQEKKMEREWGKNVQKKFPLVLIKIQQYNNTPTPRFSLLSPFLRLFQQPSSRLVGSLCASADRP